MQVKLGRYEGPKLAEETDRRRADTPYCSRVGKFK